VHIRTASSRSSNMCCGAPALLYTWVEQASRTIYSIPLPLALPATPDCLAHQSYGDVDEPLPGRVIFTLPRRCLWSATLVSQDRIAKLVPTAATPRRYGCWFSSSVSRFSPVGGSSQARCMYPGVRTADRVWERFCHNLPPRVSSMMHAWTNARGGVWERIPSRWVTLTVHGTDYLPDERAEQATTEKQHKPPSHCVHIIMQRFTEHHQEQNTCVVIWQQLLKPIRVQPRPRCFCS
jgi:hypothetical protein